MSTGLPKAYRPLWKVAKANGWTLRRESGKHFIWESPNGARVTVSGTVNDRGRKVQNLRAHLRKAGLDV